MCGSYVTPGMPIKMAKHIELRRGQSKYVSRFYRHHVAAGEVNIRILFIFYIFVFHPGKGKKIKGKGKKFS